MTSRYLAYVGCRTTRERQARGTGIQCYAVADSGEWSAAHHYGPLDNPSFLTLNQQQDRLYTVHGDSSDISAYQLDHTGRLSALGRCNTHGNNPAHLLLSPDEPSLLVANYATGNLAHITLSPDGQPLPATIMATFDGEPGPHRHEQKGSHPHHIVRFANRQDDTHWYIIPDKGLDRLLVVDRHSGRQPTVRSFAAREGSGPRHAVIHPWLPLVYVVNELGSSLTVWHMNVGTGELEALQTTSAIPRSYHGFNRAAGIAIHPDGQALYLSNRGHDSVCTFPLNQTTGQPTQPNWQSSAGHYPRFLGLDPTADFLYVANEHSDSIVQYRMETNSGQPIATNRVIHTGSPVCIVFKTL